MVQQKERFTEPQVSKLERSKLFLIKDGKPAYFRVVRSLHM